jgi:hypothetical protein
MGPRTSTPAVGTAPGRGGRQPRALGPPEVLGVPLLPPSDATRSAARVRAGLARLYHATAPPPARVLEAALGGLDPAALAALCILDIPDRLHGPTTVVQLAHDLDADPARLDRLLRYATTRGWVGLDRRGRIRATRVTAFLRRDHPGGWRAWVEFVAGAEVTAALAALDAGVQADGDAFAAANGAAFFAGSWSWRARRIRVHATTSRPAPTCSCSRSPWRAGTDHRQLAALAKHAGLVLRRTHRLASGDVAHVFQAGAPSSGE